MKRLFVLILSLLMLSGCGAPAAPETVPSAPPTEQQTLPTQPAPLPTETAAPTVPPTEDTEPPVAHNPLTGEALEETTTARPFCIMLNNSRAAMPQHGVGDADILYELLIEGETRCMGVYYNIDSTKTFGSIRSARPYFIQLAMSYDAPLVHAGTSSEAERYFKDTGWAHMDGVAGRNSGSYYYRTRGDEGYRLEHTLFIRPEGIRGYAKELGLTLSRDHCADFGLQFNDEAVIVGKTANTITPWFNISGGKPSPKWHKSTTLKYDPTTRLYNAFQYGSEYVDGNDGQQLSFRNVLVLRTSVVDQKDEDHHLTIGVTGSGSGYFACNGQMVEINWSRKNLSDPFTYTLASSGAPVTFGEGKTYIAVIPMKAALDVE